MRTTLDQLLISDFHQGEACAGRCGYRSDCPLEPGSLRAASWLAGFDNEDSIIYSTGPVVAGRVLEPARGPALAEAFAAARAAL